MDKKSHLCVWGLESRVKVKIDQDLMGARWILDILRMHSAGVRVYTSIYKPKRQFASKATYGRTCSMKIASHGTVMGPSLCNPNSSSAASRSSLKTS